MCLYYYFLNLSSKGEKDSKFLKRNYLSAKICLKTNKGLQILISIVSHDYLALRKHEKNPKTKYLAHRFLVMATYITIIW